MDISYITSDKISKIVPAAGAVIAVVIIIIVAIIKKILDKSRSTVYDYCIIGGGIAGLTAAYKFAMGGAAVTLLEKENRLGGRALQFDWHSTSIKLGAGIIRQGDYNLRNLIRELAIDEAEFTPSAKSFKKEIDLVSAAERDLLIQFLKDSINSEQMRPESTTETILEYLRRMSHIDPNFKKLEQLVRNNMGYSDFHKMYVLDFIYNYPINDMFVKDNQRPSYAIDWNTLINKLEEKIKGYGGRINLNSTVRRISRNKNNTLSISIKNKLNYVNAANIIIATDISFFSAANHIFDTSSINITPFIKMINKQIAPVSFMRGFSYFENNIMNIAGVNLISYEEDKTNINNLIIPFSKNVVMTIYTDSESADSLNKLTPAELKIQADKYINFIKKDVKYELRAADFIYKYWPQGVHTYKSAAVLDNENIKDLDLINNNYRQIRRNFNKKYMMNPAANIYVCGEMLAVSQGWVEGAVESVTMLEELLQQRFL